MTDTHVVSALKEKRIQVASQIESLQGQLRQAVIDLGWYLGLTDTPGEMGRQ